MTWKHPLNNSEITGNKKGDALILSYTCQLGGYAVECERSLIVGKPTDYAKRLYDAMLAAHDTGVENLKEGAIAQEVDNKSLDPDPQSRIREVPHTALVTALVSKATKPHGSPKATRPSSRGA